MGQAETGGPLMMCRNDQYLTSCVDEGTVVGEAGVT